MFFDDEAEQFINPELFHVVRRELYAFSSNLEVTPYGLRSVPTHTEDGIPIRKLYVANLPPKTTRTELFGVFAQYGFIKSCWLRMGDKGGPNKAPTSTYAFVTYSNPADAHKALQAPRQEKQLRGRHLRISPADSWHQPPEDADGRVRWKPRGGHRSDSATPSCHNSEQQNSHEGEVVTNQEPSSDHGEGTSSEASEQVPPNEEEKPAEEPTYTMLDILNRDCMNHILTYVPIRDLVRSERVSKDWQNMIQEYLASIRTFKTSCWQHVPTTLTTAVLRRVLSRIGPSLLRLHIDHYWSALNDRTAHTIGKFCPQLEELKIVGMHTKNWNPLVYGCKNLKSLMFISCSKLADLSLVQLVKETNLESLTIANNTQVTGLFLTCCNPTKLNSLAFYNCYNLQGTILSTALETIPTLTTLKLDVCPVAVWQIIPSILNKLPKLEELSLSEYTSDDMSFTSQNCEDFCSSLGTLKELRVLDLSRNVYVTNAVLKQIAQSCTKLESLKVSSCNSRRCFSHTGVGDEGIISICRGCPELSVLEVSYLAGLTDAGISGVARSLRLHSLVARGNAGISASSLGQVLQACHNLQELDVCGSDGVSEEVVVQAEAALRARPRPLLLRLAATAAAHADRQEFPTHKLLTVDTEDDRSNPHLRPDFIDRIYDDSSEDSMDDLYDHINGDFDDFLGPGSDDDLFLEDELEDYDGLYAFGFQGHDIILL